MRPKELADDYTGTNAVVKHALEWFSDHGEPAQYACCIYATAPFIQVEYLKQGFDKLISSGKNFVFSVTFFEFPLQRAVRINQDGEVSLPGTYIQPFPGSRRRLSRCSSVLLG